MPWLDDIILAHSELESPSSFWKWASLTAIAAILKDNVWFSKQRYNVYPNIYVMFHADSGLKKGPPINLAKKLVMGVNNVNIIVGRSSIQAIMKDMGTAKTMPGGMIRAANSVFICSSEFTSALVTDPIATNILTDLYDRNYNEGEWRSLLKMDTFTLKNPTITMLGGTNEAHSDSYFEQKDVMGGFFARTFIVYEKHEQTINSLMFPLQYKFDDKGAIEYLKQLTQLKGEFTMDVETRTFADEWYRNFRNLVKEQQIQDKTGTLNRFDDSVIKVAMLISLARNPELVITKRAFEEALNECEKLIGNVRKTTMSQGKSQWASQKGILLKELLEREGNAITRQQLNQKYYLHANANEWDEIVGSLEAGGHLRIEMKGNVRLYVMPERVVAEWKKHLEGKSK
jgi:hypothetical protein